MSRSTLRAVILVTGLITALVHLVLLSVQFGEPILLFILNGLGYLVLLAAFWTRLSFLADRRGLVDYAFMAYAAVTFLAWIPDGSRDVTAYLTKVNEVILIAALWAHRKAPAQALE